MCKLLSMITREEIIKPRPPKELYNYVKNMLKKLRATKERSNFRIKKWHYKEFIEELIEELIPLSIFVMKKYDETIKCKPTADSSDHDADIIKEDKIINKIEIWWFIDGMTDKEISNEMNINGISNIRKVGNTELDNLISGIIQLAKKKALKNYYDCQLVLVLDNDPYFTINDDAENETIKCLISELETLSFNAKEIYLLSLKSEKIIKILFKTKKLVRRN